MEYNKPERMSFDPTMHWTLSYYITLCPLQFLVRLTAGELLLVLALDDG